MKNSMIVTVGASVLTNIRNSKNDELIKLYEEGKYKEISEYFINKGLDPETGRELGAEINSSASIIKNINMDERDSIYFLVSDTKDGRGIGIILKNYFEQHKEINFKHVNLEVISKMNDEKKEEFGIYGLRNLVKKMAEIIRKHGKDIIINATGGYKAQIAFALALGQGIGIPVYYRFERFTSVIELPPLPLTLDFQLYTANKSFFEQFERNEDPVSIEDLTEIPPKLLPFIDEIESNGKKVYILSAMGQTYLEAVKTISTNTN